MAVVTNYGTLYVDDATGQNAGKQADSRYMEGRLKLSLENFSVANGDTAASTYSLGYISKDAILAPNGCNLVHGAALPADVDLGDSNDPDGLLDGYDGSSGAATKAVIPTVGDEGKPLWERLGYATAEAAPNLIEIIMTIKANSTVAATGYLELNFSTY